jgi:aspartate-semialdehyde dehydrogenase
MAYKIAVVGATGLVGSTILKVLEERNFPVGELLAVASESSIGKKVAFKNKEYTVVSAEEAISRKPHIAIFSAGGDTSLALAPKFAAAGITVIDNSSAWRMAPDKKLVVPEVNANVLGKNDKIIANPNCSTIQMVMVLKPLLDKYGLERVVVSTYQSVSGTGKKAVDQLMNERKGNFSDKVYPHQIDLNILPHIDKFMENGYTKEEMKMILETRKILGKTDLKITATTVRVPVLGGHSESVNVSLSKPFKLNEVRSLLQDAPGVVVQDDPNNNIYPMPIWAQDKDDVFVGRIRIDESAENSLNMWIVSDNLRKGAATNAVQIAEYLIAQNLV